MSFDVWLSFLLACMVLCLTPGPTVFLVMGQALNHGKKSVLPLVTGVLPGDVIAMTVSFIGLGALLATSAVLFTAFKWVAGTYLIYLGVKAWRTKSSVQESELPTTKGNKVFKEALIVTALNPKGIVFFIAFFPLFIDVSTPVLPQMLIMAFTFLFVSGGSATFYSFFAGFLRSKVKTAKFQQRFNKVSGSMLVGAGAVTATMQKG
jgi:threonine/homoserine/homoserine lactone efflux protein